MYSVYILIQFERIVYSHHPSPLPVWKVGSGAQLLTPLPLMAVPVLPAVKE